MGREVTRLRRVELAWPAFDGLEALSPGVRNA